MTPRALLTIVILPILGMQPVARGRGAQAGTVPSLSGVLRTPVSNYALRSTGLVQAVAKVAARFRIPMGVVVIGNEASRATVQHRWKQATPYAILADLAKTPPGYRIDVERKIVHFSPNVLPSSGKDFLDIRIPHFQVTDQFVELVDRRLFATVHEAVSPPKPSAAPASVAGSQFSSPGPTVSLGLENATVRQILDALVASSSHKLWVVAFPEQDGENPTGYLRTSSVDGKFIPEDRNQPSWETIRWGVDPLTYRNLAR